MRRGFLLVGFTLCWSQLPAQAPESANLWRVGTASLAQPPALQAGPVGIIWNPAAGHSGSRLSAAIHAVQTSDIVGLSGLVAGVAHKTGEHVAIAVTGGRVDVRDLVRTTSSPNSEGTIPVFTQFLGVTGQFEIHGLVVGTSIRLHDERFDLQRDHGFTLDFGARYRVTSRLVVAAATHFLPVDLTLGREPTDHFGGIEYVAVPSLNIGGIGSRIIARYGITHTAAGHIEHMVGSGLAIGGFFRADASVVRENAYQTSGWRPAVAVSFLAGRYRLEVARSSGINDLGATYRIGLEAVILP